nr:type II toxin-antitoxin system VapC family toxin [Azospirillum oleiclasticum]
MVVDASVALKWVLKEPDSATALALLRSSEDLLLPDFWLNEAANVVWGQVRRKLWSAERARAGLTLLQDAVVPMPTTGMGLQSVALDLGLAVNHSPYDCLYVAFAVAVGADRVVAADAAFVRAKRSHPSPAVAGLLWTLDEWDKHRSR